MTHPWIYSPSLYKLLPPLTEPRRPLPHCRFRFQGFHHLPGLVGGNFLGRALSYVENEIIVEGLANKFVDSFRMEHGSLSDLKSSTFSLVDEDHTLANAARFTLNQDPRVEFCGYSIPHPSDNRVNIRIQTTGDPAKDVLKDALQDLMVMCQHARSTFDKAVDDFRVNKPLQQMNIDDSDN